MARAPESRRFAAIFCEWLRIDVEVKGDVSGGAAPNGILAVGSKVRVPMRVKAGHVIIDSRLKTSVKSAIRVEPQSPVRATGTILHERIEMHPGAVVDGESFSLKTRRVPRLEAGRFEWHLKLDA